MAFFPLLEEKLGITGGLCQGEIYKPSMEGSLIYLSTDDIDESLRRVSSVGGTILFPKTNVGSWGEVAEFRDCEGNRVALFQARARI